MEKAAAAAEQASKELARGNQEGSDRLGQGRPAMLHELARQVKGEDRPRGRRRGGDGAHDLASELADREAELGKCPTVLKANRKVPRQAKVVRDRAEWLIPSVSNDSRTARTLEAWLKGGRSATGDAAARVRDVVEENPVSKVVERMDRVGELIIAGRIPESRNKAKKASPAP